MSDARADEIRTIVREHYGNLARTGAIARKAKAEHVELRLGEIEHLPVADGSVDVILSKCVIHLSPDQPAVFAEAFRGLRAGGRLALCPPERCA